MKKIIYISYLALICCITSCSSEDYNLVDSGEFSAIHVFESIKQVDANTYLFHNQFEAHNDIKFDNFTAFSLIGTDYYVHGRSNQTLECIDGIYSYKIGMKDVFSIKKMEDGGFIIEFSNEAKNLNPNCVKYDFKFREEGKENQFIGLSMQYDDNQWIPSRNSYMFNEDSVSYDEMKYYFSLGPMTIEEIEKWNNNK